MHIFTYAPIRKYTIFANAHTVFAYAYTYIRIFTYSLLHLMSE